MTGQTNETQWYIARDGKQHGPLTDVEMRTFVSHSYLRPSDLIWRPGMPDWQPAPAVFPGVFQPQMAAPGPAPAQQQPYPSVAGAPQYAPAGAAARSAHGQLNAPAPAQRSDFEDRESPHSPGSRARGLVFALLGLAVIGGGGFAAYSYRDSLAGILSPSKSKTAAPKSDSKATTSDAVDAPAQTAAIPAPAAADSPAAPAAAIADGSAYDARLQKIPVWAEIKKQYPAWYATQVNAADKLASENKPDGEIATQFAQGLAALRRQNSEKALAAGPERLRQVAAAFLDNLRSLKANSTGACYGFISKGENSPAIVEQLKTPENATAFNNQTSAIIQAAAEGAASPSKHAEAGKTDYELLIAELTKLGWKDEDLQVFSNPRLLAKREPEKVCQMVQDWFVAHLAIQDPAAQERLLYETLKPVVQG